MIPRRRWYLQKYDPFTQKLIKMTPPESLRFFWLRSTAWKESERLNASMSAGHFTQRYRVKYRMSSPQEALR